MSGFIEVSTDGHGFVDSATGERFVPMGCNYFPPGEDWPFKIWTLYDRDVIARQLAQIADAGLTVIRVFLEAGKLNPTPGNYSDEEFAKVADFVRVAADAGLRIIFSGPNYNEGVPPHRQGDRYADPQQLDHCCDLWREIARRLGNDPTIMAWDLYNEPHVEWVRPEHAGRPEAQPRLQQWRDYARQHLGADPGDSFPVVNSTGQDRALYGTYLRFLEDVAEKWVACQCEALRGSGAKQLISVGLIQYSMPILLPRNYGYTGFNHHKIAKHLDYISQHFYPIIRSLAAGLMPEFDAQRAYGQVVLRGAYQPGKPLVLEEFGWPGGRLAPREKVTYTEQQQTQWCDALMDLSMGVASGWLNWPYADCPAPNTDLSAASGLWTSDGSRLKHWGQRFIERARELKANPPTYQPATQRFEMDRVDYIYDHGGCPGHAWLDEHALNGTGQTIEVRFTDTEG